jgi:drug/metabolite transporter (DMT)-like permease
MTRRDNPPLRESPGPAWRIVAPAACPAPASAASFFIYAVESIGAAKTAFVTTSAPVFALPMGVAFLSEKLTPRVLLGTAITIAGIWLVLL